MRWGLNDRRGMTLIEIMIVIGILGILGAVAIPAYQGMRRRAFHSEVKAQLAAVYTAQKNFYSQWEMYFGDFRDIGYTPEGTLRYRINIGGAGATLPADYNIAGGACPGGNGCLGVGSQIFVTWQYCPAAGTCVEDPRYVRGAGNGASPTQNAFRTAAASDIDGDAAIDNWTIDQDKNLVHQVAD